MIAKRSFLKRLMISSASVIGIGNFAKASSSPTAKQKHGDFIHVVYFWFNEPDNESQQKAFIKNTKEFLKKIDVIVSYYIGVPANTPRDVVDNSYTFSLLVTFKNKEDQDIYQEHEAHKKYVADTASLWKKVQVYDSLKV
ncbi:MAG: Dabb family protein [Bacteroidota bacterium]